MNFLKIKLLVIAVMMFAASSAFASLSYNVSIDTSSLALAGDSGYLYLQYNPLNGAASTATVANFVTDGTLATSNDGVDVVNGTAVTGTLPGSVGFESRKSYESHSRKTKGARCGSFRCFKFVIVVRLHSPAFPCDSSFLPTGGPADA